MEKTKCIALVAVFFSSLSFSFATSLYLQPAGANAGVTEYDSETGAVIDLPGSPLGGSIGSVESQLTSGPDGAIYGIDGGRVWRFRNSSSGFEIVTDIGSQTTVSGFAVGPDGMIYVQPAGPASTVNVYDGITGVFDRDLDLPLGQFIGSGESNLDFGFSDALHGVADGRIWRYDIATSTFAEIVDTGIRVTLAGFAVGPNGDLFVQPAGMDSEISVYDGLTGALSGSVGSPGGSIIGSSESNLDFGPDGDLYGISDGRIWRYSFADARFSDIVDTGSRITVGGFAVQVPEPSVVPLALLGTVILLRRRVN